jgi:hypothetical protein
MERPAVVAGPFSLADNVKTARWEGAKPVSPTPPQPKLCRSQSGAPKRTSPILPLTGNMPTSRVGWWDSSRRTQRIGLHLALQA